MEYIEPPDEPQSYQDLQNDPETWAIRTQMWKDFKTVAAQVGEYRDLSIYRNIAPGGEEYVWAVDKDENVVGALLYEDGGQGTIQGGIAIRPDYRRQGIASYLCRKAEELTVKRCRPNTLTNDGAAFWNNPRRDFGVDRANQPEHGMGIPRQAAGPGAARGRESALSVPPPAIAPTRG